MTSAGVKVSDECKNAFQDLKMNKNGGLRYIIMGMNANNDEVVVLKTGARSEDYDAFLANLKDDTPCYAVVDVPTKNADGVGKDKIAFMLWSPDGAGMKPKMLYSSTLNSVKGALSYSAKSLQCTDSHEISQAEVVKQI